MPKPPDSGPHAGSGKTFAVGNILGFEASPGSPDFPFPHATEDCLVDLSKPITIVSTLAVADIPQEVAKSVAANLSAAFDGALVRPTSGKAYVPAGKKVRSLGAIELEPAKVYFYENDYDPEKPKLRARLSVSDGTFDLSVPAHDARSRWQSAGLAGLRADLKASKRVHVRVGLSRPFSAKPNECYSQVNGILFL